MTVNTNKLLLALLLILGGLLPVFGISVAEYRKQMSEISSDLTSAFYDIEEFDRADDLAYQKEIFDDVRGRLAKPQKVQLSAGEMEVDHQWLLAKIKEYEAEPFESQRRNGLSAEILDSLNTLDSKLREIQAAEESNRTKDEDKQKLDEILKRGEFQPPPEPEDTFLQRLFQRFLEWLASLRGNQVAQPQDQTPPQGSPLLASILLYAVIGIALLLVAFLVYKFAPAALSRFASRDSKSKESRVILGETIAADESAQDIFAEAELLAMQGNLRGAIRKGYIAVLCELADKRVIGLARHKTNRDYLRDIRSKKDLYGYLSELTSSFERNWYGLSHVSERDWEEFKETYRSTVNKA